MPSRFWLGESFDAAIAPGPLMVLAGVLTQLEHLRAPWSVARSVHKAGV
jgi:hypothetical protein